jgi:N-acylneuraminate cytidylyltransferase
MVPKIKIVAIVTARSGSKAIPHKNVRDLGGIPLLGWVVKALMQSKLIDSVILSTDSEQYFLKAKSFNDKIIFHKRSPELAEDVPSELVLLDAMREFKDLFDDESMVVLIQPTTPFITGKNIDECIAKIIDHPNANSCISVRKVSEFPEWMLTKKDDKDDICVCSDLSGEFNVRQNLKERWISNGGIWVVRKKFLEKTHKIVDNEAVLIYEMPKMKSIDIDEEDDFILCEALIKSGILQADN